MFLVNSCLGLFSATYSRRHPFSRSYGVNLPSSLTTILPPALGFSPHPPVSVYGTGTKLLHRGFSWQRGIRYFARMSSSSHLRLKIRRICLSDHPKCLNIHFQSYAYLILLRHPICQTKVGGIGISTNCPSPTPIGLGLGPD